MKITIIGTGYVGLVTGTCFAETGHQVTCLDIDAVKIRRLQGGQLTIFEPGLEQLFERNAREGRLHFTTSLADAMREAEIAFLALPTPPGEDGSADLSYVLGAADALAEHIRHYTVVVNKSTVPVGTAEKVRQILSKKIDQSLFDVVSNPEFLREGVAVEDFMKPDRVVIGSNAPRATAVMEALYEPFVRQGNPVYVMDLRSAELTKYAANAYLATRISFMNELANLCESTGANVDHVRKGIGSDTRIGKRFLFPGVGYGGSCFPKDVRALHKTAEEHNYNFRILDAVMQVNASQKKILPEKIIDRFGIKLSGVTIAVWGLAFKPNTDDIREAPAIDIMQNLLDAGASLRCYDPEAMAHAPELFGGKLYCATDMYDALDGADALALITEWNVFRSPDFGEMKRRMASPIVFDGRNVFEPARMYDMGFEYYSIGRRT
jgi:UDPglucose 6-dehydrogenase